MTISALVAFKQLGIQPEKYWASEIDEVSKIISAKNNGNEIEQIGDIRNITEDRIRNYCPINVLIGGSPCNDLSAANCYRKGLKGIHNLL